MHYRLVAVVVTAGALTFWSASAGLAQAVPADPAAREAFDRVSTCHVGLSLNNPGLEAEIAEIRADVQEEILEEDADFTEETAEAEAEQDEFPDRAEFVAEVAQIATDACQEIQELILAAGIQAAAAGPVITSEAARGSRLHAQVSRPALRVDKDGESDED